MSHTLADLLAEYKRQHCIKNNSVLAQRIGITPSGLHRLMSTDAKKRRRPSVGTIRRIADATGIDERTIVASVVNNTELA
jgi:transcriptional regulator with XRE-family HTH domain